MCGTSRPMKTNDNVNLYAYDPSIPAAITFTVLFAIATAIMII